MCLYMLNLLLKSPARPYMGPVIWSAEVFKTTNNKYESWVTGLCHSFFLAFNTYSGYLDQYLFYGSEEFFPCLSCDTLTSESKFEKVIRNPLPSRDCMGCF